MPHRIEAAKATVTSLAGNGANLVAVASAATGLTQQLNQTHPFFVPRLADMAVFCRRCHLIDDGFAGITVC